MDEMVAKEGCMVFGDMKRRLDFTRYEMMGEA
jgi:hypothetical protein